MELKEAVALSFASDERGGAGGGGRAGEGGGCVGGEGGCNGGEGGAGGEGGGGGEGEGECGDSTQPGVHAAGTFRIGHSYSFLPPRLHLSTSRRAG